MYEYEVSLIEVSSGKWIIVFRAFQGESVISAQLSSSGKRAYIKTSFGIAMPVTVLSR